METNSIDNLRFDVEGKAYFLHHSTSSNIKIGDRIKTTGAFKQATAGDALTGYSYGWDAMNPGSIANAVNNQANGRNIYITSAAAEDVFPDVNVMSSNARAIKGEQEVLHRISFNVDDKFEDVQAKIVEKLKELNIPMRSQADEKLANLEMAISGRGKAAIASYREAAKETALQEQANFVIEKIKKGQTIIPENLDEMIKGSVDGFFKETVNGRESRVNLEPFIRARAYKEGGMEALKAQIKKTGGESLVRNTRALGEAEELLNFAGEHAGQRVGVMSKKTLSGILHSAQTTLSLFNKSNAAKIVLDVL